MPIDPNWEPPRLIERESHTGRNILIILIALLLIIYVAYVLTSSKVVTQQQEIANVPQKASAPAEVKQVFSSEVPPFDSHCSVVAGVVPGSIVNADNKISFTLKNNGKVAIEGTYFEASNLDKKAYRKNLESLAPEAEATYSIDLNDVSNEVGIAVKSFIVLPIQDSKACVNQRMIVIQG